MSSDLMSADIVEERGVFNIPFGSKAHTRLLAAIKSRRDFSRKHMREHYQRFDDMDAQFQAYLPTSEVEKQKEREWENSGKMDFIKLEIPYSYATAMTAHTYWSSVFLSRSPIFQFTARHGESQDSVEAVEAVQDYQVRNGRQIPVMYNWLFDMTKYGLGIVGCYWDRESRNVSEIIERQRRVFGVPISSRKEKIRRVREMILYEGNKLFNVSPRHFYPDPRVPIWRLQDGEFCGREVEVGFNTILRGKADGTFYNVKALRGKIRQAKHKDADDPGLPAFMHETSKEDQIEDPGPDDDVGFITLMEMYIELVPKEWGLGSSERPEKWVFTVANDEVIISAMPMGFLHDQFPFFPMEYGFGTEELIKSSMLEIIEPLNKTMSWLINTHFFNIRKALNDVRIVDPSKVVMRDLLDPLPGGLIRTKPEFYGEDVRTAVHQLNVQDVTQGHLRDSKIMEELIQRVSGVVDNLMGMPQPGGRKTATETRITSGFSMNRLKTVAEYNSALAWEPLAQVQVQNTQQFMEEDLKLRLAGNTADTAGRFIDVGPEAIAGFFDFVPVDGTLPIDRLAQANFWKEFIQQIGRIPQVAESFDMTELIVHTMRLVGEKNVERFKVEVTPDESIQRRVENGELTPVGGGSGTDLRNLGDGPSGRTAPQSTGLSDNA